MALYHYGKAETQEPR